VPASEAKADYWGDSRFFLATELDLGFLYFRPRLSAGYGRPFKAWLGLDANPLISFSRAGGYSGARFKLPMGDLRVGGRFEKAFQHTLLVPQHSYGLQDIELREGRESHYLSWEAQLTTFLPAGPGGVLVELTGTAVTLVDEGFYVFEETAKIIVDPPWLWRARLGYGWRLLDDRLTIAPVMELAHVPKREMLMVRGGLLVSMKLYESLWLRVIAVPTLAGRDTIGADGADTFLAGIRWRWATGLTETEWPL